jgi:hypothetical protein
VETDKKRWKWKRNGGNEKETLAKGNDKETSKKWKKTRFGRNGKETLTAFCVTLSIYTSGTRAQAHTRIAGSVAPPETVPTQRQEVSK